MKLPLEQQYMLSVIYSQLNTMPADALATLGASASSGMVLTPKSWNIPSPASEELRIPLVLYQQSVEWKQILTHQPAKLFSWT